MKANQTTIKKIGKRIYTLKELAQRDFGVLPKTLTEATSSHFSLVNIQEDLLDDDLDKVENKPAATSSIKEASGTKAKNQQAIKAPPPNTHLVLPIKLLTYLIEKEIATTAKHLALEVAELQAWIDLQVLVPKQTLLALLRLARANNLDPLKEEVALALYEDER